MVYTDQIESRCKPCKKITNRLLLSNNNFPEIICPRNISLFVIICFSADFRFGCVFVCFLLIPLGLFPWTLIASISFFLVDSKSLELRDSCIIDICYEHTMISRYALASTNLLLVSQTRGFLLWIPGSRSQSGSRSFPSSSVSLQPREAHASEEAPSLDRRRCFGTTPCFNIFFFFSHRRRRVKSISKRLHVGSPLPFRRSLTVTSAVTRRRLEESECGKR